MSSGENTSCGTRGRGSNHKRSQPLPADHPYLTLDNVLITPHLAGITEGSMRRMGLGVATEAKRALAGELPLNFCNPEVLGAYRERFPAE